MAAAQEVFGEFWFWVLAAVIWTHAATVLYGAPRRLIIEAQRGPEAAAFLRDTARFTLSRPPLFGQPALAPALFGVAVVFAVSWTAAGDPSLLGVLVAWAPPALAERLLADRARSALSAARDDANDDNDARRAALSQMAFVFEQIWRVRLAAIGCAIVALLALSAALSGLPQTAHPA